MESRYKFFYNYFQILNKSIIRKIEFHLLISLLDVVIILLKLLNIYQTNYNTNMDKVYKKLSPALFFLDSKIILRILPILIYLIIVYLITIVSLFYGNNKKINKLEMIIINIFEHLFIRILFIFFLRISFLSSYFIFNSFFYFEFTFFIVYFY